MARFYGEMQGSRGECSRLGTVASGIRAHIRGWDIGVCIYGRTANDDGDADAFDIYATRGSNDSSTRVYLGHVRLVDGVPVLVPDDPRRHLTVEARRLEEIRDSIRAENVSYGELAELQDLAPYIAADDVELREAAGMPEH